MGWRWGFGWRKGWMRAWPGNGPFSYLPPWERPGWRYGPGSCWRSYGYSGYGMYPYEYRDYPANYPRYNYYKYPSEYYW